MDNQRFLFFYLAFFLESIVHNMKKMSLLAKLATCTFVESKVAIKVSPPRDMFMGLYKFR